MKFLCLQFNNLKFFVAYLEQNKNFFHSRKNNFYNNFFKLSVSKIHRVKPLVSSQLSRSRAARVQENPVPRRSGKKGMKIFFLQYYTFHSWKFIFLEISKSILIFSIVFLQNFISVFIYLLLLFFSVFIHLIRMNSRLFET